MDGHAESVAIVRVVEGPWGPLHVAATRRGIIAAESMTTNHAFASAVAHRVRGIVAGDGDATRSAADPRPWLLDRAEAVIAAMIDGRPPTDAVPVDLADRPRWDQVVLAAVRMIGWGETASYGTIARMIGAPRAARAVGGALGRNPVALLIPCHRIIAGDGTIGGYGGDGWGSRDDALARKRALLLREGIVIETPTG